MTDGLDKKSDGRCLLLVEDEYIIADDLALSLEQLGFEVVGPAGSVQEALDLVRRNGDRLDGAVLDINLRGERAYPIADALSDRGVPFVFTTGYDTPVIPAPTPRSRVARNRSIWSNSRAGFRGPNRQKTNKHLRKGGATGRLHEGGSGITKLRAPGPPAGTGPPNFSVEISRPAFG